MSEPVTTAPEGPAPRALVLWHLAGLAVVWLLMILAIHPAGNFPYNDDWSFAHSVQWLLEGRGLRFTGWVSMPLVAQVLWGALFCLPGGFSFTALRVSTLVLGLVGIAATYLVLRELRPQRGLPLWGALVLAANPIYVVLSTSFMTDVPFAALSMVAFLLFVRAGRRESWGWLAAATVMACVATLVRQVGLVLPIAFGLVWLIRSRRQLLWALSPAAVTLAVLVVYQHWLVTCHGLPAVYNIRSDELLAVLRSGPAGVARHVLRHTTSAALYLGLFLLPLLVARLGGAGAAWGRRRGWVVGGIIGATGLLLAALAAQHEIMPIGGNTLTPSGIGPRALRDVYLLNLPHVPALPRSFWMLVTVAAALGAALLLVSLGEAVGLLRRGRLTAESWPVVMGAFAAAGHLLPMVIAGYFDRYLLAVLPPLVVGVCARSSGPLRRGAVTVAGLWLAASLLFSVVATRDFYAWDRARWQALDYLTDTLHIAPTRIDGGFEFGGWHLYDAAYRQQSNKSWWWVQDDEYMVTCGAVPGYETLRAIPYRRLLPPGEGRLHVLRRSTGSPASAAPEGTGAP